MAFECAELRQAMSRRKSSATAGVMYLGLSQVALQLCGYGVHVVTARALGPHGYGIYGVVFSTLSLPMLLVTSGLPQALSKLVSQHEDHAIGIRKTMLKLQLGLGTALAVIFFLGAPLIAGLLSDAGLISYLRFSAISIPLYALFYGWASYLNGLRLFREQSMTLSLYAVVKFSIAAALVGVAGIYGALSAFLVAPLVALGLAFAMAPRREGREGSFAGPLVRFALPFAAFAVAIQFLSTLDLFLVKALIRDELQVGLYTAASTLARVPYLAMGAVGMVMLPSIANSMRQGATEKTTYLVRQTVRLVLIILVGGVTMALGTAEPLLLLVFSEAYAGAASAFSVLVVGTAALGLSYVLGHIAGGAGEPQAAMRIALLAVPIGFGAGYILVPQLGLQGAAIAVVLVGVLTAGLAARDLVRRFGSPVSGWFLMRLGLAGAAVTLFGVWLVSVGIFVLLVYPVLVAVYLGALLALREIRAADIAEIRAILTHTRSSRTAHSDLLNETRVLVSHLDR